MVLDFTVYQLYYPSGKAFVGYCLDVDFIYDQHAELLRKGKHPMKNLQKQYSKFGLPDIQIVDSGIASKDDAEDAVLQVWKTIGAGLVIKTTQKQKNSINKIDYINFNNKLRCKYTT